MSNTDSNLGQDYESLINNAEPIDAEDSRYEKIFMDLQGGIIKNYGRNYYLYIFISFDEEKVAEAKQWIRDEIVPSITSTYKQFHDSKIYKQSIQELVEKRGFKSSFKETYPGEFLEATYPGELCKNFFLSNKGYKTLGFINNINEPKRDPSFSIGMKMWWENNYKLKDNDNYPSSPEYWDIGGGKDDIHALILLFHNDLDELKNEAARIMEKFERQEAGKILGSEVGYKLRNEHNHIVGPFGFVDSFSQPVFLKSDYDKYCQQGGTDKWDPKASLSLVLVKDPFGESYSFGSYCVWQKLETNYKCFKDKEKELAAKLGCDQEMAAALAVGRFRDGTPIALHPEKQNKDKIENNFNYDDDSEGAKCPFQAHIRKVNPRGDQSTNKNDVEPDLEARKKHRIFRAGVTYFNDPKAQQTSNSNISHLCLNKLEHLKEVRQWSITDNIENISGLLFVCFQRSIVTQFQKLQLDWADNKKFPREFSINKPKYLDPIVGHPKTKTNQDDPEPQEWSTKWNGNKDFRQEDVHPYLFYGCVENKGGEFFFAPSISFLKKI